jgi:hypothetical protein
MLPHPDRSLYLCRLRLVSFLFPRYKDTFPGLEKRVVDQGKYSEVKGFLIISITFARQRNFTFLNISPRFTINRSNPRGTEKVLKLQGENNEKMEHCRMVFEKR